VRDLGYGRFVIKSIKRRTFRNAVTILTFAVIAASLLLSYFLVGGAQSSTEVGMSRLGADILVVPQQYHAQTDAIILTGHPSTFYFNSSVLEGVKDVPGVQKVSTQTFIATLNADCCALPTQLIAFNATQDFTILPWLSSNLGRPLRPNEIVLGHQVIGGAVSEHMIFYGHEFVVAGILERTGTGIDASVFIQDTDAFVMAENSATLARKPVDLKLGQISSVLVKVTPGASSESVAALIEQSIPGASTITSHYLAKKITDQLAGIIGSLQFTAMSVTIVTVPLVATVSSMVANERKREIGLLRSMGASRRFVFLAILVEALVLATAGALIGALVSGLLIWAFQNLILSSLSIPFLWPSVGELVVQVGMVAFIAVAIGGLAATYPAIRASRIDPYEAIRSGQA